MLHLLLPVIALFACPDCNVDLQIISLDPAKVDLAPEAE